MNVPEDRASRDDASRWHAPRRFLWVALALCASAVTVLLISGASPTVERPADAWIVYARGEPVRDLEEGAPVVLGERCVGRVFAVNLVAREPMAVLALDPDLGAALPKTTRFEVRSTNRWMPGHIGVVLDLPATSDEGEAIEQGAVVDLGASLLPDVPSRFWLLLGGLAVVLAATAVVLRGLRLGIRLALVAATAWVVWNFIENFDFGSGK